MDAYAMDDVKRKNTRHKPYTPTPKPLVELCLGCNQMRCNGSKCYDYRRLEKEIRKQKRATRGRKE